MSVGGYCYEKAPHYPYGYRLRDYDSLKEIKKDFQLARDVIPRKEINLLL